MSFNKKINILFVSIAFPPKKDPESLQVAKYLKYLLRNCELEVDAVTSANPTLYMPVDNNLKCYAKGVRNITEIKLYENKYLNYVYRKLCPSLICKPDTKYKFHKKWRQALVGNNNKPDLIYSRSFPMSSTIMAYNLQKYYKVPWILHLSDPWTISPIHSIESSRLWNETMELECFKAAKLICLTSQKTIDLYAAKYPELSHKFTLFPNVFDADDLKDNPWLKAEKIKIVYTGGLAGSRSPLPFMDGFKELKAKHPYIARDFEIVFVGEADRKNREAFLNCDEEIQHKGVLSFSEALLLQSHADMLLLIDTNFHSDGDAIFFPSKLLDYMLAKRRVIAISNKNSTSWSVVEQGGLGDVVHFDDKGEIVNILLRAWEAWRDHRKEYFEINKVDAKYSAQINAERLSGYIINETVSPNRTDK